MMSNNNSNIYTPVYVVVTVAKNEELIIEKSIISIVNQSILPKIYVIVDDGSTDSTSTIIKKYAEKYPWIVYLPLPQSNWDIGVHYSYICRFGFEHALLLCSIDNVEIDFISLVDADTLVEQDYFRKIYDLFSKNLNLGIVSGDIYHKVDDKYIRTNKRSDFPSGTGRCWRMKCFEETGGYILDVSPDYISNIRAQGMGWLTARLSGLLIVEQRSTGFYYDNKSGNVKKGKNDYHLYLNPLLVVPKSLLLLREQKKYSAFWYLYGYLSSLIRREKVIDDPYVRHYCMVGALKDMWEIHFAGRRGADNILSLSDDLIMDDADAEYFDSMQCLIPHGKY